MGTTVRYLLLSFLSINVFSDSIGLMCTSYCEMKSKQDTTGVQEGLFSQRAGVKECINDKTDGNYDFGVGGDYIIDVDKLSGVTANIFQCDVPLYDFEVTSNSITFKHQFQYQLELRMESFTKISRDTLSISQVSLFTKIDTPRSYYKDKIRWGQCEVVDKEIIINKYKDYKHMEKQNCTFEPKKKENKF